MTDLTIPVDSATDTALDEIATATKRSKAAVAADLLSQFVRDEADVVAAILRGRADVDAGRTTAHEDAMARLRKTARGE
ncbi:MAG: CopG family transcriptional regulator [Pseudomonadota bacterium]